MHACHSPADVRPLPEVVVEVVVDELDGNQVPASGLVSYPVYAEECPKDCGTVGAIKRRGGGEKEGEREGERKLSAQRDISTSV